MKTGIIIVTSKQTEPFYNDLIFSLRDYADYPVYVHRNTEGNNQFEMGGIKLAIKLGLDEFFLLPDTCKIKDTDLFRIVFEDWRDVSVSLGALLPAIPCYVSYLGKYRLDILKQIELPEISTKEEAVRCECYLHEKYLEKEPQLIQLFPDFWLQEEKFEEKHGRNNLINENEYLKKYKATYKLSQIEEIIQ